MKKDVKDSKIEVCMGVSIEPYTKITPAGIFTKDYAIINENEKIIHKCEEERE